MIKQPGKQEQVDESKQRCEVQRENKPAKGKQKQTQSRKHTMRRGVNKAIKKQGNKKESTVIKSKQTGDVQTIKQDE